MNASLWMLISSGPHQSIIGNRLSRQMLTAVRRLCGHRSIGPSGVRDQSYSPMRRAISPSHSDPALVGSDRSSINDCSSMLFRHFVRRVDFR